MLLIGFVLALSACTKQDPAPNNSGTSNGTGSTSGTGSTGGSATVTAPNTFFIASQDYVANGFGAYWIQSFTIYTKTTFVFRFASQYKAQASIITEDQLPNFENIGSSFNGYYTFDNQIGTNSATFDPGTYYLAIRNTSNGTNKWSTELDYPVTLPASDRAVFYDYYVSGVKSLTGGSQLYQSFTIQTGYRYFIDGCNVNCDIRIIPASDLNAYQNKLTYNYFTDYYDPSGAAPGLWELKLPPGDYDLVSSNAQDGSITYVMERWKLN